MKIFRLTAIIPPLLLTLFALYLIFPEGAFSQKDAKEPRLYGDVSEEAYLTGRFNPAKHKGFVKLTKTALPSSGNHHYLRAETVKALLQMYRDLKKDHPEAKFWIQSSTRNWYSQKAIWERQWNGKTLVGGKNLSKSLRDPEKRARRILQYSSMPGTSRHHWGTDFDICVLKNRYYETGNGAVIYRWLKINASRYGFCQPYTADRTEGYKEERWHWSYVPLSSRFRQNWNRLFQDHPEELRKGGNFAGAATALKWAPVYVNSIGPECQAEATSP